MRRVVLGVLGTGAVLLVTASPASATITQGPCSASGTFSDGTIVPAEQPEATIPANDTVAWQGSLNVPPFGEEVPYSGSISVELPFGSVTIRDWSGESDKVADMGVDVYEIPDALPGMKATVRGEHSQGGVVCRGEIDIEIDGGPGPVGAASVALTGASAAGLAFAARGRP